MTQLRIAPLPRPVQNYSLSTETVIGFCCNWFKSILKNHNHQVQQQVCAPLKGSYGSHVTEDCFAMLAMKKLYLYKVRMAICHCEEQRFEIW
jgi:hypothetical protein